MSTVIAHRGASAYAPENTLAAFAHAYEQGADMIELDVQCSADGVPVVFHDSTTERWDGHKRPVASCTLHELRQLDIDGECIATLDEVCRFARTHDVALNVELKQRQAVQPTVALLQTHHLAEQTLISAFDMGTLMELLHSTPPIKRGYIMGTRTLHPHIRLRELWPFFHLHYTRATAWHPNQQIPLLRSILPLVRRAGYAVNVWTVDDPVLMRTLVDWGASGIITNKPDVARAWLHV